MRRLAVGLVLTLAACGRSSASTDAALQDCVGSWRTCVKYYLAANRKLADDTTGLLAWAQKNDAMPTFRKDPWGRDPEYRPLDMRRGDFEILSLGEDGYEGTDDDMIYRSADDKIASRRKRYDPAVER